LRGGHADPAAQAAEAGRSGEGRRLHARPGGRWRSREELGWRGQARPRRPRPQHQRDGAEAPQVSTGPALDAVVIGGGIAGLWVLDRITAAGYSSLLLERAALGARQTIASQGIIHGGAKYEAEGKPAGE